MCMEKLFVKGEKQLFGQVKVDGSKNAFLPILAGCVLCDGQVELSNFVDIADVRCMCEILNTLSISTQIDKDKVLVNTKQIENLKITHELTKKVRASIFLLGALLGRFREAVIAYPGGCKIGARPIDIHLKGFRDLGAKIIERHGYIYCHGQNLKAGNIELSFPSVGATESLMMCACTLDGVTTIKNVAKEPEIVDLQNFLNAMGANVHGAGTDTLIIEGVKKFHSTKYSVMPDRIVAGTYLLAAATCGGDILLDGAIAQHNEALLSFLKQTACQIDVQSDRIRLKADKRLSSISNVQTGPYPLFPTDLQPQMMVLQSVSDGVCHLTENVFENRFGLVPELVKMGADIAVDGRIAHIVGKEKLYGADVYASDLRAGASLVIAGLVAEGYTTIYNAEYIDRGYEKIEEKFGLLGADIQRIK